jgi:hypothetical protein
LSGSFGFSGCPDRYIEFEFKDEFDFKGGEFFDVWMILFKLL